LFSFGLVAFLVVRCKSLNVTSVVTWHLRRRPNRKVILAFPADDPSPTMTAMYLINIKHINVKRFKGVSDLFLLMPPLTDHTKTLHDCLRLSTPKPVP
jgi:hypothetical protein